MVFNDKSGYLWPNLIKLVTSLNNGNFHVVGRSGLLLGRRLVASLEPGFTHNNFYE